MFKNLSIYLIPEHVQLPDDEALQEPHSDVAADKPTHCHAQNGTEDDQRDGDVATLDIKGGVRIGHRTGTVLKALCERSHLGSYLYAWRRDLLAQEAQNLRLWHDLGLGQQLKYLVQRLLISRPRLLDVGELGQQFGLFRPLTCLGHQLQAFGAAGFDAFDGALAHLRRGGDHRVAQSHHRRIALHVGFFHKRKAESVLLIQRSVCIVQCFHVAHGIQTNGPAQYGRSHESTNQFRGNLEI